MKKFFPLILAFLLTFSVIACSAEVANRDIPDISTVDLASDEDVAAFVSFIIAEDVGENESIVSVALDGEVLTIEIDLSETDLLHSTFTYADIIASRAAGITDSILDYPELDACWEFILVDAGIGGNVLFTKSDIVESAYGRYFEDGAWNTF